MRSTGGGQRGCKGVGRQKGHHVQMLSQCHGGIASRLGRHVSVIGQVRY